MEEILDMSKEKMNPATKATKSSEKVERLHLSMTPALKAKLIELQRQTHANNVSDVVRNAILLYTALVKEHSNGKEILVRSEDGKEKAYAIFL